jgi:hypothetical protein
VAAALGATHNSNCGFSPKRFSAGWQILGCQESCCDAGAFFDRGAFSGPGLVMAGHSRSKNGVASLAYVTAIHVFAVAVKTWMPGTRPGMTE